MGERKRVRGQRGKEKKGEVQRGEENMRRGQSKGREKRRGQIRIGKNGVIRSGKKMKEGSKGEGFYRCPD